jgi:hypothetical protein
LRFNSITRYLIVAASSILLIGNALLAQEPTPRQQPLDAVLTPPRFSENGEGAEAEPPENERASEWETDRDSFTPSTKTAGRRRLIVESASR